MKLFRNEAGQSLVLSALLMCVVMGFMALAIDMGVTFRAQRRLQTQADAAAIAAALCGTYGGSFCTQYGGTDVTSVAQGAAQNNGMPSATTASSSACSTSPCMQVHTSPSYGQHANGGYFEVIIKQQSATPFMGTFGALFNGGSSNNGPLTVGARAVAGMVPGQTCLYLLNPTADKALYLKGNATLSAPNCSIQVNSNANDALCTTGGSGTITSQQILVVGEQGGSGNCNNQQSNVQTGGGAGKDPLANMVHPDTGCTSVYGWGGSQTDTLAVNGSGQLTLTNPNTNATQTITGITFTPVSGGASTNVACFEDKVSASGTIGTTTNEVFVFQNGLTTAGSGLVTFNGTVEISAGDFQEQNSNVFINGPTGLASSQPYTGMALLVYSTGVTCSSSVSSMGTIPSGDGCLQAQFGSGGSNACAGNPSSCSLCTTSTGDPGIVGTIYAPKDVVYLQDNGGCVSATNVIADELWDKASDLTITNYNLVYTTSPLDVVRLVE